MYLTVSIHFSDCVSRIFQYVGGTETSAPWLGSGAGLRGHKYLRRLDAAFRIAISRVPVFFWQKSAEAGVCSGLFRELLVYQHAPTLVEHFNELLSGRPFREVDQNYDLALLPNPLQ